eukprot:3926970-Lingulodinium_polyedra.AAC.1
MGGRPQDMCVRVNTNLSAVMHMTTFANSILMVRNITVAMSFKSRQARVTWVLMALCVGDYGWCGIHGPQNWGT